MPETTLSIVESLFANNGQPEQPVDFEWRLICKRGHPFLLLLPGVTKARRGLNLYSAHRRLAKIWRALLPAMLQMPAAKLFPRIHFRADASSDLMQFLAQQAGMPATSISLVGIKVSEVEQRSRLMLLLCDESNRPTRVIKVGLNADGKIAIEREADLLSQLPPHMLGCVRMTGRLTTPTLSALATDYFPGAIPHDDAGMEHLFHAWLNPEPPVLLEELPTWRELAAAAVTADPVIWRDFHALLAGKKIRTTLYHGDFAPWNVRVVNSQNLQAFDWERGQRWGIPGWDWFHFVIQTSILAKGYSSERIAVELEQVIRSERFRKYAVAAGISDIVQPLVLAYLLHQHWVVKPGEGRHATFELFEFLSAHWQLKTALPPAPALPRPVSARSGLLATVRAQLKTTVGQWCDLFWEPSLNSIIPPSFRAQLRAHWRSIFITALLLVAIATVQYHSNTHLIFLPFYVAVCAFITMRIDRRWGALTATIAAVVAPVLVSVKDARFQLLEIMIWNTSMRFFILQLCVLFVDRIYRQKDFFSRRAVNAPAPKLADVWVTIVLAVLLFTAIVGMDYITDPHLIFIPLYLLPCMMFTLVLNLPWGIAAALFAAIMSALVQYVTGKSGDYTLATVFGWNLAMRFAVFLLVITLLDRIRKGSILFHAAPPQNPSGRA